MGETRLDLGGETSRVGMVMAHVRDRVARGGLGPGARLPSIRACAQTLGVSTSTVVEAYDRLAGLGEITSRRGAGFYVAGSRRPVALAERAPAAEREVDPLWVLRRSLESGDEVLKPGCGWLPESWMPTEALRRALRAQTRAEASVMVGYGPPLGYEPLRTLLARRLGERDIPASADRILLTDSATLAVDLIGRLFVRPGDTVLVDDPCYFNFMNTLRALGARVEGVPFTPQGPDLEAFEALARAHSPRLYLTTGALHNPTGVTAPPTVLHRLLKLLQAHDMVAVEDDIFADFETEPTPRLAAFDGLERVIHIGSFSKSLSASLRCGFIAARPDWIEALADLKLATSYGASELTGRVLYRLLSDGTHRRHIEGVRTRLAKARAETRARLQGAGLTLWSEPQAGIFLWARLPDGLDAAQVSRRAAREGVVMAPGDIFSVGRRAGSFLRFNATHCPPRVFEVLERAMAA